MRVDLFDFELPPERIALRPARPRDSARLLVAGREGRLSDRIVSDLPGLLRPGDVLVVAGKGHETGQSIRGVTLPFSDVAAVAAAIQRISA